MALNIPFDGYIYFGDNSISNSNISYQAYFYKVNSGSSTSKWNSVRIVESSGYYAFNLGDNDFLGQTGSALDGDIIIVVSWSPATSDRLDDCSQLYEWSVFRAVLDGSINYTNDIQVKSNICPNLNWSLQATGLVNQTINISNTSNDIHQWTFSGNTMYQRDSWYTTLMTINNINNTDYYWGDTQSDLDLPGASNGSHFWSGPGDYEVNIVVEDSCGCTVTGTDNIIIYNNLPVPNITMFPTNPLPNEQVYFMYTGTDPDNAITAIYWEIVDEGIYGNTTTYVGPLNVSDEVYHTEGIGTDWYGQPPESGAFTNPGNHEVFILYEWWNGFTTITGTYSEIFSQEIFSGPAVDFEQEPEKAVTNSGVNFNNTTTNYDRVGLGLPDHIEYVWTWDDNGAVDTITDVPFSYILNKIPTSDSCTVELCAYWSDGWETQQTCVSKAVVFDTLVTVTPTDCYYNLNIIGTSDDGTVSGYGWTISSGISISGPWTETWSSPVGISQNDKKVCFTNTGYYKIEGTVYGSGGPTNDDEVLYITEVCPATEAVKVLWNGTGVLDVGGDWAHSGFGIQTEESKHTGTYGLDTNGMKLGDSITFTNETTYINSDGYDYLRIWVNVLSWSPNKDLMVYFTGTHTDASESHNSSYTLLNNYISVTKIGVWQKAMIPLMDFAFDNLSHSGHEGLPFRLKSLIFQSAGQIDLYIDDIELVMGVTETITIPVCAPEITSKAVETKTVAVTDMRPSMRGQLSTQPSTRVIRTFPGPLSI